MDEIAKSNKVVTRKTIILILKSGYLLKGKIRNRNMDTKMRYPSI